MIRHGVAGGASAAFALGAGYATNVVSGGSPGWVAVMCLVVFGMAFVGCEIWLTTLGSRLPGAETELPSDRRDGREPDEVADDKDARVTSGDSSRPRQQEQHAADGSAAVKNPVDLSQAQGVQFGNYNTQHNTFN